MSRDHRLVPKQACAKIFGTGRNFSQSKRGLTLSLSKDIATVVTLSLSKDIATVVARIIDVAAAALPPTIRETLVAAAASVVLHHCLSKKFDLTTRIEQDGLSSQNRHHREAESKLDQALWSADFRADVM